MEHSAMVRCRNINSYSRLVAGIKTFCFNAILPCLLSSDSISSMQALAFPLLLRSLLWLSLPMGATVIPQCALLLLLFVHVHNAVASSSQTYIVHVSKSLKPPGVSAHMQWYSSMISSLPFSPSLELSQIRTPMYEYRTVFHGFAAKLTPSQAQAMEDMQGVLSVVPDSPAQLHTTRTPEFMGLHNSHGLWPISSYGEDVIIGVMDSGIWPEKKNFQDAFLGPPPTRWKGECEAGTDFSPSLCNHKLIGARAFYKGYEASAGPMNETLEFKSARDSQGHGTHTASTAAGNHVRNASLLGSAPGTARGIATHARIAMYKVCWKGGCFSSDLLAAFDKAVEDGVDIISLSIGGGVLPYFLDPIAIGSFGAMENGVVVVCSAGNGGPSPQSITNVSPWLVTVAASTLDRDFPAIVKLGDGSSYEGASLYVGKMLGDDQVPLVYAADAGEPNANGEANFCRMDSLSPELVKGKIVVCDRGLDARAAKGMVVKQAGGAGMILANAEANGEELIADSHVLPAALVGYKAGLAIKSYIAQSQKPTTTISFRGTVLGSKPAPVMAAFSSRGPSEATPEILKPDVTAPGVNILAAWVTEIGPSELPGDDRIVDFNIMSGTSMSCPHVSGLAALLRKAHLDWSPAAIKSALMTTAFITDSTGSIMMDGAGFNQSTPFAYGAGHVDPAHALNAGLLYDIVPQDYVDFLCALNYTSNWLMVFTKGRYNCSNKILRPQDLNYPSLSFVYKQGATMPEKYTSSARRTVTNVGMADSVYSLTATAPQGVRMKVEPSTLSFTELKEKRSFQVTCEALTRKLGAGDIDASFGSLVWSDRVHRVQSPVVFMWQASRN